MIKHFCDKCGKEIVGDVVRAEINIRSGLPRLSRNLEYHLSCVDEAFGEGFSASIIAEDEEKTRVAAERKAKRMAERCKEVNE